MKKTVVVDKNKCTGCGTCISLAPGVFEWGSFDDKKVSQVKDGCDFAHNEADILDALDACPEGAISIEEEDL